MRVGDDRRFVQSFPFEDMTAIISHFKFVAGMNVGEKGADQLDRVITLWRMGWYRFACRLSGDYRGYESLVIRLLHDEERELRFWFDQLPDLKKKLAGRGLYLFAGPVGSGKTTLACVGKSALQASKSCLLGALSRSKQDNMLPSAE